MGGERRCRILSPRPGFERPDDGALETSPIPRIGKIHEDTFADPYAIPRTVQALVAATPVGLRPTTVQTPPRQSLAELILKTQLLQKPTWA